MACASFTLQMNARSRADSRAAHLEALRRALLLLERTSLPRSSRNMPDGSKLRLRKMPKTINDRLNHIAEIAILKSLDVAIKSIKPASKRPQRQNFHRCWLG